MSNNKLEVVSQVVMTVEPQFNELAQIHGAVNFKREASFALQALKSNNYLAMVAQGAQDSLKQAVINVAAIGLSLNPVEKLAYLVPRDKKVHLDISYQGYIQLGVLCGAIKWAKAELVYEDDNFLYRGMGKEPHHMFSPFKERGALVGVYCVAKTPDGEFLTEIMTIEQVYKIRDRSMSWRAYKRDSSKKCPWVTDPEEMIKKTVVKRAYKWWPKAGTPIEHRLAKAVDVSNEAEGFDNLPEIDPNDPQRLETIALVHTLLEMLDRTQEQFLEHSMRVFQRDLKSVEEMTDIELERSVTMLRQFVTKNGESNNEEPEPDPSPTESVGDEISEQNS